MAHTIEEQVAIPELYGLTISAAIEALQSAVDAVPKEFRDFATLAADDCYEDGINRIKYTRGMNAEELAKSEALLSDRAALIAATSPWDLREWVRAVRLRRGGITAEEAIAFIREIDCCVELHPRYDADTHAILL